MKRGTKIFSLLDVSIIILITSVIMYFLGSVLIYRHLGGVNYSIVDTDGELQEFISAYDELNNKYYDNLDKSALIEGAIKGMYGVVDDPYTTYLDTNNSNVLNDSLNGEYQGIGIRILTSEENTKIIEVFKDSPAEKAGIKVDDIIVRINGMDAIGKTGDDIVEMIKSSDGKNTEITVLRDNEEYTYKVDIANLFVPAIETKLLTRNDKNVGYIRLSVFNDTADVQFEEALTTLENSKISALIIDLRSNSGGYLHVASNIAEMFLEKGKIIYSLEDKESKTDYKDKTSEKRTYPIGIIINNGSASASEILAAALKYSYGASLHGTTSFGKGKVQEKTDLTNGTSIKYTTAKWLTPAGDCIDEIGLEPDEEIPFNSDNYNETNIYSDNQVVYTLQHLVD